MISPKCSCAELPLHLLELLVRTLNPERLPTRVLGMSLPSPEQCKNQEQRAPYTKDTYVYTCVLWKRKNIKKSIFCKAKGSASGRAEGSTMDTVCSMEVEVSMGKPCPVSSGTSRASSADKNVQRHC